MGAERRDETLDRPHWRTIALIALIAVVVRLIIAYAALPPEAGFTTDLQSFRFWAAELGANGPWGFYSRGFFVDYLPGYLALLWPLGAISGLLTGTTDPGALVKLPAIIADGLLVLATARLAFDLGASRRAQVAAALAVALLPATWIDSTIWGQVDSVGTCVLLFAASELVRGRSVRASALTALAATLKPQFGVIIPVVAVVVLVRAIRSRDPWRFAVAGLAGVAVIGVVALPFGFTLFDVFERVLIAAGGYEYLTVGAWNPWALVSIDGVGLATNGAWAPDIAPLPGIGISGVVIGAAALVGAIAVAAWRARHDDRVTTIASITLIAVAFFVLPTRVHERYLFAAIPLATALAAANRRWITIAVIANLLFAANTWSALTREYLSNPGIPDLGPVATALHDGAAVTFGAIVAAALLALTAVATWRSRQTGSERHARGDLSGIPYLVRDEERPVVPQRAVQHRRVVQHHRTAPQPERPVRRRGIDRVDLWMLLVVFLAALSLRGWRIGDPPRFHFDEVYHVRTATEFLQDWRYGEPHAIYEYTHPHLAKYAIALGFESIGAPRVDARSDYGTTITAVASRGSGSEGPPRIWIATPSGVDVIDPSTRTRIGTISIPGVVAMSLDRKGGLWGATSSGGIFHADPATADSGAPTPIVTPRIAPNTTAITATEAGALIIAAGDELLRFADGAIVARVRVDAPHDLLAVAIGGTERVAVSGATGISLFPADLSGEPEQLSVPGGVGDMAAIDWTGETLVYATTPERVIIATLRATGAPTRSASINISGGTAVIPSPATRMIHVVAPSVDGTKRSLWSIEPNGNARFADTPLDLLPADELSAESGSRYDLGGSGIALDASTELPNGGRGELIVASGDGAMVQVAIGDLPAGWRWPGVLAGAIAAALLVLLARLLTDRRDVAALTGVLSLLDGAAFVQSRIGMNDVYLLLFLLGAFVSFIAWIQGRARSTALSGAILALAGLLLGAALASKWVALYGAAGLALVWLGRSAVGRLATLVGLVGLFALLLPQALAAGDGAVRSPNLPFTGVAIVVVAATAAIVQRTGGVRSAVEQVRNPAKIASLTAEGLLLVVALIFVPLGFYLASYLPWIALGNQYVAGVSGGTGGQTLVELTASMYRYHDTLRVAHAASSPWWAWPLDLKPVWFFQDEYTTTIGQATSGSWSAAIYDGGNVLSRILGIGGLIWTSVVAWRKRSAAHAMLIVLYLAMWLPWARIDRASFQYHYYPAAQLSLVALAVLLADVRTSNERAMRYLRRAAAAAVLFAPLAWSLTGALCVAAGVAAVNPQSQVCLSGGFNTPGPIVGALALIPAALVAWSILGVRDPRRLFRGAVVAIALVALIWYPNWSALPLPTGAHNWYQGLLSTWIWAFQFGVTLAKPVDVPFFGATTVVVALLLLVVAVVSYVAATTADRRRVVEFDEDRA